MTKEPAENQNKNYIYKMSENEKIKEMAEAREAYLRDQRNAFYYYEEKGIKKGEKKGEKKGIEKIVANMRKKGIPENIIQEALDFTQDED
ncbi:MAG: hypothetical protein HDT44_12260 [Ruminococcaceae bacterium]|nr:hypothetical protein [Oscillospiraceae bacterium]